MSKVGDVFRNEGEWHIVTQTVGGEVKETEPLKDFIMRSRVVQFNGEYLSINEVIHNEMDKYINIMGNNSLEKSEDINK